MQGKAKVVVLCAFALVAVALLSRPAITAVYSTPVRNIEDPARNPVQVEVYGTIPTGQFQSSGTIVMYTVPTGYRLVIDTISGNTVGPRDERADAQINPWTSGAKKATVHVPFQWAPLYGNRDVGFGTTPVRAFADEGCNVTLVVIRLADVGGAQADMNFTVSFSGHLIPLP